LVKARSKVLNIRFKERSEEGATAMFVLSAQLPYLELVFRSFPKDIIKLNTAPIASKQLSMLSHCLANFMKQAN